MKKENKKRIEKLFLAILIYVLLVFNTKVSALTTDPFKLQPFSDATKNGEEVYDANTWDVFKNRTKEQIVAEYNKVAPQAPTYKDGDSSTYYTVTPSLSAPYAQGAVTQDIINIMTAETNYYRWLMGYSKLNGVGSSTSEMTAKLQIEALARNFCWGHQIDGCKNIPNDYPDDLWTQAGPTEFEHNILADNYTPRKSIAGWISEGYKGGKFDTIGHRIALIDPTVVNLDFGYSGDIAIGKMWPDSNANKDVYYGAFPVPGYMPMNNINAFESSWTIALNPSFIKVNNESNVVVKVTNLKTNSSYTCTKANGKLKIENPMNTVPYLNYVQPDYKYGDKYKIEVTGLVNKDNVAAKIQYTTELFDITNYVDANIINISHDVYDSIEINNNYQNREELDIVLKILPEKIRVTTDIGIETYIDYGGQWSIRPNCILNGIETSCLINYVSTNNLPSKLNDPYKILDNAIPYEYRYSNNGTFSASLENLMLNQPETFTITKPDASEATFRIYQIKEDNSVILRKESTQEGNSFTYSINSLTTDDLGTYIGAYISTNGVMNITGIKEINEPAGPSYVIPTNLATTYGKKLSDIKLPAGFTWDNPNESVGNVGTNTFKATYSDGFNTVPNLDITIKVNKADPNPSSYTIPTNLEVDYGKILNDISLPNGFTWKDSSLSVGNAGTNKFTLIYTPTDTINYNILEREVSVKVNKIDDPTYREPTNLQGTYSNKLSSITLPTGFTWQNGNTILNEVGTKTYKANYKPTNNNYKEIKDISLTVTISKKSLAIPYIDRANSTYNFKEQSAQIVDYDKDTMTISGDYKATNVGTYTAIISLKDKNNYEWIDNSTDDISMSWTISKLDNIIVDIKGKQGKFVYDGEEKTVSGYTYETNNSLYTDQYFILIGKAEVKRTEIGEYFMGLTESDFVNNNTNVNVKFNIVKDGLLKITLKEEIEITGLIFDDKEYDGELNVPKGELKVQDNKVPTSEIEIIYEKLINDNWEIIEEKDATSKGSYRVTYKIPESNPNYEGSVSYNYDITKKKITLPTLVNNKFTYDKTEKEVSLNNINSELMTISGDLKKTESGDYKVVISLNNTEDYSWNNSSSEDIELTWKIEPVKDLIITIKGNNKRVIYDGEEHTVYGYTYTTNNESFSYEDLLFKGNAEVIGTELGSYYMNLNANQFEIRNNNYQNVKIEVEDGKLLITLKEPLTISGLEYNNKVYTGSPYAPTGELVIQDNKFNIEDLKVLYEGISGTYYNSSIAPTNAGEYQVTYSIPEDNEYYTGSISYTFSIIKVIPEIELPTGLTAERNTRLVDIKLPTGFAWKEDYILTPGLNVYSAVYIPSDIINYQILDNLKLEVLVNDYRIEEEELEYTVGETSGLTFTFVAENVNVESVIINDEVLDEEYYIVEDNTITIFEEYIDKLQLGSYSIEVLLEDGEKITKVFTKKEIIVEENPDTSDNIMVSVWLLVIGFITLLFTNLKRIFN